MLGITARIAARQTARAAAAPTNPYEFGGPWNRFTGTVDFASMAAGAQSAIDVAVPAGLVLDDGAAVLVSTPSALVAVNLTGRVKTGGAFVTVIAVNTSGGTLDPASTTVEIRVAK